MAPEHTELAPVTRYPGGGPLDKRTISGRRGAPYAREKVHCTLTQPSSSVAIRELYKRTVSTVFHIHQGSRRVFRPGLAHRPANQLDFLHLLSGGGANGRAPAPASCPRAPAPQSPGRRAFNGKKPGLDGRPRRGQTASWEGPSQAPSEPKSSAPTPRRGTPCPSGRTEKLKTEHRKPKLTP